MSKYVRTPKNEIFEFIYPNENGKGAIYTVTKSFQRPYIEEYKHMKQADTIEELIQVGDIVFYWVQSDDTERCEVIVGEDDIRRVKFNTLTKLLVPIEENYKCVAKAKPVFAYVNHRRYLQAKGELELL